jgi:hypothetical protein
MFLQLKVLNRVILENPYSHYDYRINGHYIWYVKDVVTLGLALEWVCIRGVLVC